MMTVEEAYEILETYVTDNAEALDLAFGIDGWSLETAEAILSYYTGWHNFEGFLNEIRGEDE